MADLGRAVLELTTEDSKYSKGLADAKRDASSWSDSVSGFAKTAGLAIAAVGVAAVTTAVGFVRAAAEEEVGINRLASAINAAGGSWDDSKGKVEAYIASSERLSAFSDNDLRKALALLVAQTGDVDEAMVRLSAAQDLARGTGMDLETASRLLGKATDENANVLARYGIHMEKGATATELMIEVQKRFGGQSEAYSRSVLGQWEQVQHQFGNLAEDIGGVLLPVASYVLGHIVTLIDNLRSGPLPGVIARMKEIESSIVTAFSVGPVAAFVRSLMTQLAAIPGFVAQIAGSIGEVFDVLTGRRPEAGGVLASVVGTGEAGAIMSTVASVREAFRTAFEFLAPIIQGVIDKVEALRVKFGELPPVIQAAFAGLAVGQLTGANDAVLGLGASLATMASGLVNVGEKVPAMLGAIQLLPTALGLMALEAQGAAVSFGALALAALPWIALAAAVGIAIYLLVTHWEELGDTIRLIGLILGHFIGEAGAAIGDFLGFWSGVWKEITDRPAYWFGVLVGFLFGQLLNLAKAIGDFAGGALATITTWMGQVGDAWNAFWAQDIGDVLGTAIANLIGALFDFGGQLVTTVMSAALDLGGRWFDFWFSIPGRMLEVGEAIVRGIWQGIQNLAGWLIAQATSFAQGILDGIKAALGIHSPSEAFAEVGANIVQGLAKGITDNSSLVTTAMQGVVDLVKTPFDQIVSGINAAVGAPAPLDTGADTPGELARTIFAGSDEDIRRITEAVNSGILPKSVLSQPTFSGVDSSHSHDIYLDGARVGGALGNRTIRGAALAGASIG